MQEYFHEDLIIAMIFSVFAIERNFCSILVTFERIYLFTYFLVHKYIFLLTFLCPDMSEYEKFKKEVSFFIELSYFSDAS